MSSASAIATSASDATSSSALMESYISDSDHDTKASKSYPVSGPQTTSESIPAVPLIYSGIDLYSAGLVIISSDILSPATPVVSSSQTLLQNGPTITLRESTLAISAVAGLPSGSDHDIEALESYPVSGP